MGDSLQSLNIMLFLLRRNTKQIQSLNIQLGSIAVIKNTIK